jgi:hypothetical protein
MPWVLASSEAEFAISITSKIDWLYGLYRLKTA